MMDALPVSHVPTNSFKALTETQDTDSNQKNNPHPVLIHHMTPDRRHATPFIPALRLSTLLGSNHINESRIGNVNIDHQPNTEVKFSTQLP